MDKLAPEPPAAKLPETTAPARASSPDRPKPVTSGETAKPLARPVPNPAAAALRPRTSGEITPAKGGGLASWLIVPLALLVGVAMGALAFFLSRH